MQLFDPNNPSERKKAIVAAVLAIVAIAVLGYVFFGSSGTPKKPQSAKTGATPQPPLQTANTTAKPPAGATVIDDPRIYTPVVMTGYAPAFGEPNRNIFAYYEPPPTPPPVVKSPTPIPTPTPPVTLNSLMPAQVYARTADFTLQAMGDKFTPAVRITVDGRELPTRFINAQEVAATVPAALIATPGVRQVTVRSSDGQLYSLPSTLNVAPPPIPNYTYIGIIGKPRANDVAVLQDKGSKELLNVQRGDVLGGRFRVTSISERELVLTDTNLKIKHTLPFTTDTGPGNPFTRPGPKNADDEP